jgi:stage III sporulation protein AE
VPAQAVSLEEVLAVEELQNALPEEAEEFLSGTSPTQMEPETLWTSLSDGAKDMIRQALSAEMKTAGILLIVCVLIALSDTLDSSGNTPQYILIAGVAAVGAAAMDEFDYYMNLGLGSVRTITDYSKALLPVLASAAAAAGSVSGAAARYGATALFLDLLTQAADRLIVPGISACAALSIADAAVGNQALKTAKKLVKSICRLLMTVMCMAFTAWLSFSGIVTDSADAVTARMAKTAVSAALPVVGSILSDAAGTLAAAAGSLRSVVGVYGAAAVLCVCLGPFITLGCRYLVFKISAALCGCVSDKRLTGLVEDLGSCFGMVLALNGTAALMIFMSIYSLIRTAVP